jgi:PPP family 3-phenylpropionic acid transporter
MSRRSVALRVSAFYASMFLVVGIMLPFWPLWLEAQGLTAVQIGILLSVGQWVKVGSNPLIARLSDRHGESRRALILVSLGALASFALFAVAQGFVALLIVSVLSAACVSALFPLGDSFGARAALAQRLDYGRMRLWGSLAFIAAAGASGWFLSSRATDMVLPLLLATSALTALACWGLPTQPVDRSLDGHGGWTALASRRLLLLIFSASATQSSHGMLYAFGSLHWQSAGYGEITIGALWGGAVLIEVVLFAIGGRLLRRYGAVAFLVLAGLSGVLRWSLAAASTELWALVIVQVLHAVTFGATHLAIVDVIAREAPPRLANTAQSLYSAAVGVTMGTAMLGAGPLYQRFGGTAFLAMAALTAVAAVLALAAAQRQAQPAGRP